MPSGSLERFEHGFDEIRSKLNRWGGSLLIAVAMYVGSRAAMQLASKLHWMVGLLVAVVFSFIVYTVMRALTFAIKNRESATLIIGLFLTTILTAISVCAWLSFALHEYFHAPFQSSRELSPGSFCDLFTWIFIDMIPVVEIWKTLHVAKPIESLSPLAAIPELLFRVLVAIPLISALKEWLTHFESPSRASKAT